jgi:hypothetical protein
VRCLSNRIALAMVFKLAGAARISWPRIRGNNQFPKLILGVKVLARAKRTIAHGYMPVEQASGSGRCRPLPFQSFPMSSRSFPAVRGRDEL